MSVGAGGLVEDNADVMEGEDGVWGDDGVADADGLVGKEAAAIAGAEVVARVANVVWGIDGR